MCLLAHALHICIPRPIAAHLSPQKLYWRRMEARQPVRETMRAPAGGFRFITVAQLMMVWHCYRQGHIRLFDLHVWFALNEVAERRCVMEEGRRPQFTPEELHSLVGRRKPADIRASVRRLQATGLVRVSRHEILFAKGPEQLDVTDLEVLDDTLNRIANRKRKVPVPRRILRLMAGGARRVLIATILGHLLRAMYFRDGGCRTAGSCKASWVAQVFGVNATNVKTARSQLVSLGWLRVHDVPQWYLNRYGAKVSIHLEWSKSHDVGRNTSRPPRPKKARKSRPPESNKELPPSEELTNQDPRIPRAPGVCGREKDGIRPTLMDVKWVDLTDTKRLIHIFREAAASGLAEHSKRGLLDVVAAAEHARVIGTRNPPGLFAWIVRNRKWDFITEADEIAAHNRLLRHQHRVRKRQRQSEKNAPRAFPRRGARSPHQNAARRLWREWWCTRRASAARQHLVERTVGRGLQGACRVTRHPCPATQRIASAGTSVECLSVLEKSGSTFSSNWLATQFMWFPSKFSKLCSMPIFFRASTKAMMEGKRSSSVPQSMAIALYWRRFCPYLASIAVDKSWVSHFCQTPCTRSPLPFRGSSAKNGPRSGLGATAAASAMSERDRQCIAGNSSRFFVRGRFLEILGERFLQDFIEINCRR